MAISAQGDEWGVYVGGATTAPRYSAKCLMGPLSKFVPPTAAMLWKPVNGASGPSPVLHFAQAGPGGLQQGAGPAFGAAPQALQQGAGSPFRAASQAALAPASPPAVPSSPGFVFESPTNNSDAPKFGFKLPDSKPVAGFVLPGAPSFDFSFNRTATQPGAFNTSKIWV